MPSKSYHVNDALDQLRISGITASPTPAILAKGLERLENMMAEFNHKLCVGYNFEDTPDPLTESGVERRHFQMMATNLAVALVPDFNKTIPAELSRKASGSYSSSMSMVASENIRPVQPPNRMPRGSGSTYGNNWPRYNVPVSQSPNNCYTNKMIVGEIDDYSEPFNNYLDGETISSFVIVATTGLSVVSSSNTDETVNYRIQALDTQTEHQQVTITVTTSSGRISERVVDFGVFE